MPRSISSTTPERLHLVLSPDGHLRLATDAGSPHADGLDALVASRIRTAFAAPGGAASGLLHLGAIEVDSALPPAFAFWRDYGRRFMSALCALGEDRAPASDSNPAGASIPLPDDAMIDALISSAPPFEGSEYLSADILHSLWKALTVEAARSRAAFDGPREAWLHALNPVWNLVGRVHFHLAENRKNNEYPFAFMATYTHRVAAGDQLQHVPLGRALEQYAGAKNHGALLSLLAPVQRATEGSAWLRERVASKEVFRPQALTAREAHAFLRDAPGFERAGVVVRVPDWWKARTPPRPKVTVSLGSHEASTLGLEALVDFRVSLAVDGETITPEEWNRLRASTEGLVLLKGRWVELDRERLTSVLDQWKKIEALARDGVTIADAMRMLAGASFATDDRAAVALAERDWASVVAGPWLARALRELREPSAAPNSALDADLKASLRPYQATGVGWLWGLYKLGLGGCLADDMGLGKTLQVIALLVRIRAERTDDARKPSLVVAPASLLGNWRSELERFAPTLAVFVAHPSETNPQRLARRPGDALAQADIVLTTYGSLQRYAWMAEQRWNVLVLDEAQAIKNPGARQTRAAKAIPARTRLALTGTPVENRLGDLWSIVDYACPGLLGSPKTFSQWTKQLSHEGGEGYAPLRTLLRPYILRRLKTDKRVIADLPDKTEVNAWCTLTKHQAVLYQETVDSLRATLENVEGIQRRGTVLSALMRFKQICNHPSQGLSTGGFETSESGKFQRLVELCGEIAARQEKVLVFTQFREVTDPIAEALAPIFGRRGFVLHGETPLKQRQQRVEAFQALDGPGYFVLTVKAGGTGLNLTAASHVIHFDRWWNPAVENQATDRAFRIGQKRNVLVHKMMCRGTVEERIDQLIESKRALSREVLEGGQEIVLTELRDDELLRLVSLDITHAVAES